MGFVEEMKWWQWIVVSLLVGAALGYINTQSNDAPAQHASMDTINFEQYLLANPIQDARNSNVVYPWINHIVIFPPKIIAQRDSAIQAQLVTFTCVVAVPNHPEKTGPQSFAMVAPCPYVPKPRFRASPNSKYPGLAVYIGQKGDTIDTVAAHAYGKATVEGRRAIVAANYDFRQAHSAADRVIRPGQAYFVPWNPDDKPTIREFIEASIAQGAHVSYRYAWWQSPDYAYEIWMAGSFVVLGVIWPMLLRTMVTGGMGRVRMEDYDLTRFRGGANARKKETRKEMSAADILKLTELEASLKASLKAGEELAPAAARAPEQEPSPQIIKLQGTAAGEMAAAPMTEEEKHYTGQYYPVVLPEAKPDDAARDLESNEPKKSES
ncbi:MAG: hypothetical protein M3O30_18115 [Planctomycetota bacterium]|nr:hypothetical protein [Planctomycetota bacterium]